MVLYEQRSCAPSLPSDLWSVVGFDCVVMLSLSSSVLFGLRRKEEELVMVLPSVVETAAFVVSEIVNIQIMIFHVEIVRNIFMILVSHNYQNEDAE